MEDSKTLLFYLFGLAGLITLSILFTGRIEPPPVEPLLPTPVSPTATPTRPRSLKKDAQPAPSELSFMFLT